MNIGELVAHIKVENKDAVKGLNEVRGGLLVLDKSILSVRGPMDQLFSFSMLPLLTQAIGAVWELSGAMGVVPAALGAGALAMGVFKIATQGMSDAMKNIRDPVKFAEDIKTMDPAMQGVMLSIQKLIPTWDTLVKRTQGAFWSGLNHHVDLLGSKYLPVLNTGLFKTANGLNRGVSAVAQFMAESAQVSDVSHSFDNMGLFIEKLAAQFPNLIALLLDFVTVGSNYLPQLADWIGSGIEKFTQFIDKARESGQLGQWIQTGIDSLKMLGEIVFNVGAIFVSVFQASGQSGAGLLQTIRDLTASILTWVQSAEGQEKIAALFEMLGHVAIPLLTIIPMIANFVFLLAQAFTSLPGPIQSVLGFMLGWGGIAGIVISRLWPLIGLIRLIKLETIAMVASSLAQWTVWAAGIVAQGAVAIASLTATAAKYVAQWSIMAAGAMARAVVMAAAWFVAMGPIGWVILAVTALVALIIWKWDEIVAFTKKAWDWIGNIISIAWDWIKQKVMEGVNWVKEKIDQLQELPGKVRAWFGRMRDGAVEMLSNLINWVRGVPGHIMGALGDLGRLLWDAGRRIIQGLIDGIRSMISSVGDAIGSVTSTIRNALPFSPAKWGPLSGSGSPDIAGEKIGQMLAEGIRRSINEVSGATVDLTNSVNPMQSFLSSFLGSLPIKQDIIEGLQDALGTIRLEIDGTGVARIVNNGNLANTRRRL